MHVDITGNFKLYRLHNLYNLKYPTTTSQYEYKGFSCDSKPILQVILLATAMLVSFSPSLVLESTTKCPKTSHRDTNNILSEGKEEKVLKFGL